MRKHSLNLECEAVDLFHDLSSSLHLLALEAQETLNLELFVQIPPTHMMARTGSKPRSDSSKLYVPAQHCRAWLAHHALHCCQTWHNTVNCNLSLRKKLSWLESTCPYCDQAYHLNNHGAHG